MHHTLALVVLFVVGCRSAPAAVAADAAPAEPAPAPVGPCRDEAGPLPFASPAFAANGAITFAVSPEVSIDDQVHDVVRTMGIGGSTTTPFTEVGQLDTVPPPACTYTVVTPTQACLLAPTGNFWARRSGSQHHGTTFAIEYEWWIVYELRASSCVMAPTEDRGLAVLVAGQHPELRVVRFGFDVSYSGSGRGGPTTQSDGTDLRPLIAVWPADEQARYRSGPGFAAFPSTSPDGATKTRELTWFSSPTTPGEFWAHRLRDRDGKVLLETSVGSRTVLRDGARLYWPGGRIR